MTIIKNSQKGFIVPVLLVIIAILIIGGGVYVYENKIIDTSPVVNVQNETGQSIEPTTSNQTAPQNSVMPKGTSNVTMSVLKIPDLGLSFKYDPVIWSVQVQKYTNQPYAVFSKEKLMGSVSESFENARYLISWQELPDQLLKAYGDNWWSEVSECDNPSWIVGSFDKTINGVRIQGCKKTIYGRPGISLFFTHPISNKIIILNGNTRPIPPNPNSSGQVQDIIDDKNIHNQFEKIVSTINFENVVKSEISQSDISRSQDSLKDRINDSYAAQGLNQIKSVIEIYKESQGFFPNSLNDLDLTGTGGYFENLFTTKVEKQRFRYFKCPNGNDYHLAISLKLDESKKDPNVMGLSNDLDSGSLCSGDPINGTDTGKCIAGDVGNYCYDINHTQ